MTLMIDACVGALRKLGVLPPPPPVVAPVTVERESKAYEAPLWLLAPPSSSAVPWELKIPTLDAPVSQLCTSEQMRGELYETLCREVDKYPHFHRKVWEYAYIWAALRHHGLLRPGMRMLGFGVGKEPLPSAMAARGVEVVATDAPPEIGEHMGWASTDQFLERRTDLHHHNLLSQDEFDRLVRVDTVDMNAIPARMKDFDACWSSCALEHLGSIDHGLDFIENSLATLRPGGLAVHTTEFNLSSNTHTFDQSHLSLFRRCDIERLMARLTEKGYDVAPLNLYPGSTEVDQHIDLPPYGEPHLKLDIAGYVTTSFGIIVRKPDTDIDVVGEAA